MERVRLLQDLKLLSKYRKLGIMYKNTLLNWLEEDELKYPGVGYHIVRRTLDSETHVGLHRPAQ